MSHDLSALSQLLLSAATKAGADAADAMVVQGTSVSIGVRGGALEEAERAEGIDLGLRVLLGHRQACVSASDISASTIREMAERAVAMAAEAPEDPSIGLADPDQLAHDWDIEALELCDPTAEPMAAELQDNACRAEAAGLAVNGISQVQSASAGYSAHRLHLSATNGFSGGYARTNRATTVVAITGDGTDMERDYASEQRIFQSDLPTPEEIGVLAAERTLARKGAKQPPSGAYPVLYDERIASGLIGHLLGAANGAMIVRGGSWLRDKMGAQVLPSNLSIIEDPHRPRVSASRAFDAEGLPTQRRAIVEDGVLRSWSLDLATARKLGLRSTANASRGTSAPPAPSFGNIALSHGHISRDGLLAEMGTGLLVTSLMGSSINPTTGDYSRGASGFWVENGQIAYPVNECTIAGNLLDMLMHITPANDGRFHLSRVVPSLLVEGLTVAGT